MVKKYRAESALLLNTIIWGLTFVIIKDALSDVSPMVFVSIRFVFAALILLPFMITTFKHLNRKIIYGGLILGFLYFMGFSTQTLGLNFTTATKSGFITGTFVIFTPLFQLIIEKRMPTKINIAGTLLVLIGLLLLSSNGNSILSFFSEIGSGFNIGDFLTLICAVFFALYLVYLDIISRKFDYMPLVFLQVIVTGIGGIIFLGIFSFSGIEQPKLILNENVILALLYTSLLATIITTIIQTRFQKVVSPTKAGIILSFEPIFAALFAFFLLSEKISNLGLLGCTFIFSGLLITEIFTKNKNLK